MYCYVMLFDEAWRLDDASWNHPYQPFKDLSLEPSNSCFYRLFSEQPKKNEDLSDVKQKSKWIKLWDIRSAGSYCKVEQ